MQIILTYYKKDLLYINMVQRLALCVDKCKFMILGTRNLIDNKYIINKTDRLKKFNSKKMLVGFEFDNISFENITVKKLIRLILNIVYYARKKVSGHPPL